MTENQKSLKPIYFIRFLLLINIAMLLYFIRRHTFYNLTRQINKDHLNHNFCSRIFKIEKNMTKIRGKYETFGWFIKMTLRNRYEIT